jgi:hypothetical protein
MSVKFPARRRAIAAIAAAVLIAATPAPAAAIPGAWATGEPVDAACTTGGLTAFDNYVNVGNVDVSGVVHGWTVFCREFPTDPPAVFGVIVFFGGRYEIQHREYYGAEGVVKPLSVRVPTRTLAYGGRIVLCVAKNDRRALRNGDVAECLSVTLVAGQPVTTPTNDYDPLVRNAQPVSYATLYPPDCNSCMNPAPE